MNESDTAWYAIDWHVYPLMSCVDAAKVKSIYAWGNRYLERGARSCRPSLAHAHSRIKKCCVSRDLTRFKPISRFVFPPLSPFSTRQSPPNNHPRKITLC